MKLRWGFKAEANAIARDLRPELGLAPADPLDPRRLAEHLAIPIINLTSLRSEAPGAVARFTTQADREAFSAVTVFRGPQQIIVVNDAHSPARQASSLAHELAHSLLWHEPSSASAADGIPEWNAEQEEEAQWLAGALLISDEAALRIAQQRLSLEEAARAYGTSIEMMRGRINVTAARRRVRLARGASTVASKRNSETK